MSSSLEIDVLSPPFTSHPDTRGTLMSSKITVLCLHPYKRLNRWGWTEKTPGRVYTGVYWRVTSRFYSGECHGYVFFMVFCMILSFKDYACQRSAFKWIISCIMILSLKFTSCFSCLLFPSCVSFRTFTRVLLSIVLVYWSPCVPFVSGQMVAFVHQVP